jgi:hypothetical protein
MSDFAAQQVDEYEATESLGEFSGVGEISRLRKDEPDTVVFRVLWTVSHHEHDLLSNIDGET